MLEEDQNCTLINEVVIAPDEMRDLVAECVLDKINESKRLDLFLDSVIGRVNEWQGAISKDHDIGQIPLPPKEVAFAGREENVPNASTGYGRRRQLMCKYEDDPFSLIKTRALVSCLDNCSREGGIFELDFAANTFRLIVMCDGRGIAKCGDRFLVASRDQGVFLLDNDLNVQNNWPIPNLDLHGVACGPDGLVYIVETKHNRVGIYSLDPFRRVDEIVVSPDKEDRNHINDLCFRDGNLLISMFSAGEFWRKNLETGLFDGAIGEYDPREKKLIRYIVRNLRMPHTLKLVAGEPCYCESYVLNVNHAGQMIAQFSGYTRGLDFDGKFLFIGQSRLRHRKQHDELTLSSDAGIHILDPQERMSRFVHLPASEVYAVHVLS
jgi:hypothetical protein